MHLIKVAAAAVNQTPLDWEGNARRIREAIAAAREQEVSLLCLPELCITGYGCEDAFYSTSVQQTSLEVLRELLPETAGMIVSFGLPLLHGGGLFNMGALAVNGRLAGMVGKQNLAGDGVHYEPRWFKAWPVDVQKEIDFGGKTVPVGDITFNVGGVRIGFEICEDAWVARRPGAQLAQQGVDIILNPSASHFAFGKQEVRERFVLEGSRAFGVGYIYANLLGNESGRIIYDGETMIGSCGTMLAIGERFRFEPFQVTTAVLDIDASRMNRARTGSFKLDLDVDDAEFVNIDFQCPGAQPSAPALQVPAWEHAAAGKEEEFTRAVSLALFDYLRKSWSRGWIVSLSGGADSAACSVLCAMALRIAVEQLGIERVKKLLPHIGAISAAETADDLTAVMLSCVYQATRNSGEVTENAAREIAAAIGAEFLLFDVDEVVQDYIGIIEGALGRELTWETDDIALQNIQARARSPSVWMLANIRGALLLSTSNRSEAAVGYATMDGDTSGGLSPIAGIDKAFLRQWLRWMESAGPAGYGPIPALGAVNAQQPTAELRPPSAGQTDEDDLMPYPVLDAIEGCAIRDKQSPVEVFRTLRPRMEEFSGEQLAAWITRFFRLWCRNQWKRERYAPSFHVDDKNLDPKTWCRFPILSGGFTRELAELEEYVGTQDGNELRRRSRKQTR